MKDLGFNKTSDYLEIKIFCMAPITTNNMKIVKKHISFEKYLQHK